MVVLPRRFLAGVLGILVAVIALITCASAAAPQPQPQRIVSTSPSITETLFALGLGDRVVGVTTFCRFPAEVARLPKIGTFLNPDAERIAGLRPDLVIVHEHANGVDRRLTSLRIPFVIVQTGSLASVFSSITQIGTAAGTPERATTLIAAIQQRLQRLREQHTAGARPRVLFLVGRRPGTLADLIGVGPGTYLNELITIAGGINVLDLAGQPEYPHISLEAVLRFDPDVIIDTVDMGDTAAEREQRRAINQRLWASYGTLNAVKHGRVRAATTDALVVPGPRVVDAAEWIGAQLAPATR
jgi:iron complex transport system substrate-binding protein